ncbi:hypothetical protein [Nioella sp.]|uniref:hypothetical protein n=1 Tax=Nioella sp. TaxID=1912091 RepID=UPI003A8770CC
MKHDRKLHGHTGHAGSERAKRSMSVQQGLEWAFRVEHAQLELPEPPDPEREHGFGFGLEYVLLQRAILGCKVDGGRYKIGSYTHEDAEVIAATVAGMPGSLGGKRMAIRVAELARVGLTPDWMPGAVPRCVPVDIKRNRHGDRAVSIVIGTERVLMRGKWRSVEVRACPVTFRPDANQIEAARRDYQTWCNALGWIREALTAGGMLHDLCISAAMPRNRPWLR